ncbi:uncharacterized protein PRCAT00003697001 [Priceomyces carsonii]|uniref:uncharacterized protein n=1 Tax=Priceomyces carsonii TaxID=28549 RepID=UPI002ED9FB1D|nr:unnamed protein product [Priceomyces carsonii]
MIEIVSKLFKMGEISSRVMNMKFMRNIGTDSDIVNEERPINGKDDSEWASPISSQIMKNSRKLRSVRSIGHASINTLDDTDNLDEAYTATHIPVKRVWNSTSQPSLDDKLSEHDKLEVSKILV